LLLMLLFKCPILQLVESPNTRDGPTDRQGWNGNNACAAAQNTISCSLSSGKATKIGSCVLVTAFQSSARRGTFLKS